MTWNNYNLNLLLQWMSQNQVCGHVPRVVQNKILYVTGRQSVPKFSTICGNFMQRTIFWLPASTQDSGQPYIATLHHHHTITTCGFVYLMFGGGGGTDNNSNNEILCGVNRFLKSLRWVIVGPSLSFMPSASLGHKWQCRANNHSTSGLQKSITPHKITLLLYCLIRVWLCMDPLWRLTFWNESCTVILTPYT